LNINISKDAKTPESSIELSKLEVIHAIVDNYIWLAIRYDQDIFIDIDEARGCVSTLSNLIQEGLKSITKEASFTYNEADFQAALKTLKINPHPSKKICLKGLWVQFRRLSDECKEYAKGIDCHVKLKENSKKLSEIKKAYNIVRNQYEEHEKHRLSRIRKTKSMEKINSDSKSSQERFTENRESLKSVAPLIKCNVVQEMKVTYNTPPEDHSTDLSYAVKNLSINDPSTGIAPETDMDYGITVTIRGGRIQQ